MVHVILLGKPENRKSGRDIILEVPYLSDNTSSLWESNPIIGASVLKNEKVSAIDELHLLDLNDVTVIQNAEKVIQLSGVGIDAFLFVHTFGENLDESEVKIIERSKYIFGKDVFNIFGIIILTHSLGEVAYQCTSDWMEKQSGITKDLFEECSGRFALFNYTIKDQHDLEQLGVLYNWIHLISTSQRKRYTLADFFDANKKRQRLTLKQISPRRLEECNEYLRTIQMFVEQLTEVQELKILKSDLEAYIDKINIEFGGNIKYSINILQRINEEINNVKSKIEFLNSTRNVPNRTSESSEILQTKANFLQAVKQNSFSPEESKPENGMVNRKNINYTDENPSKHVIPKPDCHHLIDDMERKERELLQMYTSLLSCKDINSDGTIFDEYKKQVKKKQQLIEKYLNTKHGRFYAQARQEHCEESASHKKDQVDHARDVNLILVGNAGNGKSATGNSILGRNVFKTTTGTSTKVSKCVLESFEFEGLKINVIDCPAFNENKNQEEQFEFALKWTKKALKLCNFRFSALVYVFKYGSRFTKEESEAVEIIKITLGDHVFREYGFFIVTHGDNFYADNENEIKDFNKWCLQQEGEIQTLVTECKNRCFLFDNKTKDKTVSDEKVKTFLNEVLLNKKYTKAEYKAAIKNVQKVIIKNNAPKIKRESHEFVVKQRHILKSIEANQNDKQRCSIYINVSESISKFEEGLLKKYKDTDGLNKLNLEIRILKQECDSKIRMQNVNKSVENHNLETSSMKCNVTPTSDENTSCPSQCYDKRSKRYNVAGDNLMKNTKGCTSL